MRITVWNINGLRTLKGYQPWYKLPDWEACLEYLGADIACFQETKLTRKQLTEQMCILPSYNAFFNFHPMKGYSGTVTYVRKSVSIPLKAEQGITGRLVSDSRTQETIGCLPSDTKDEADPQIWNALDEEGRAVVLDLGMFVLFNVYAPNETGPERLDYKMTYYKCLAERAHLLIEAGREVMIVGDMNIIRDPIDHCDPEQTIKEHGWTHFHQHPARSWFASFLAPYGKFYDVGRMYHPERRKMFTCWNTLIDARPSNYGVRLDYTLVTEGLLPWIKGADIQPDIYGSDHCPIFLDLYDEREIDGKVVTLKELMHGGQAKPPPALAACNYDEFSGKQRKLGYFFTAAKKRSTSTNNENEISSPLSAVSAASQSTQATFKSSTTLSENRPPLSTGSALPSEEEPPLAAAFFALHSQQEGCDAQSPTQGADPDTPVEISSGATSVEPSGTTLSIPDRSPTTHSDSTPSIPLGIRTERSTPPGRKSALPVTSIQSGKKQVKSSRGQTRLQSFFAKSPTTLLSGEPEADRPGTAGPSLPKGTRETDLPASGGNIDAGGAATEDAEDHIQDFQDATSEQVSDSSLPSLAEKSASDRVGASLAWGAIFSPLPTPVCRNHAEPCRAWTVNKPGPNHGRKFWLCARPVGPGYEKSGRAKGDVNPEFRCNFFLWDSDLRSEASRQKKRQTSTSPTKDCVVEGKFFAEIGRDRKRSKEGQLQDGHVWGPHKKVRPNEM